MRKFQFRLEAVERHRTIQEQERQVWLAKCLARMRATERRLLELDMKEVQARREFSALGSPQTGSPVNSAKFWLLDQFILGQKIRRVDLKQQLQIEEQEVANAYRDFLRARQQKKIMEKLREKKFQQHKEENRRYEGRKTDEQYVMRARLGAVGGEGAREDGDEE
jgi:flagellar FliJ protein